MAWIAGADGCRAGWFRACLETETGETHFSMVESALDLLRHAPRPSVVGLDIPIGLPDAGPRACDQLARERLGRPRASSVFPVPLREALHMPNRAAASQIHRELDGRKVGVQSWALYPKIREVDELLATASSARRAIYEVHPELSFQAWNQERPMQYSKKLAAGRRERLTLAEGLLGAGVLTHARSDTPKKQLADDDILDAVAALWTALRIHRGQARCLPPPPPPPPGAPRGASRCYGPRF